MGQHPHCTIRLVAIPFPLKGDKERRGKNMWAVSMRRGEEQFNTSDMDMVIDLRAYDTCWVLLG